MRKFRIFMLTLVFTLISLVSFGAQKSYLQISDIDSRLNNVLVDEKPLFSYGEDKDGFISYVVVDETSFDEFFKSTARLDAISNIANLIVTEYNKNPEKNTNLIPNILIIYEILEKEYKNIDKLKENAKSLSDNVGKVKLTKKIYATQGIAQSIKNLNNISTKVPNTLTEMKKILGTTN